jgi:hypothetical protein
MRRDAVHARSKTRDGEVFPIFRAWHDKPGVSTFRQLCYFPSATQRFDQKHARVQATLKDIDVIALIAECCGLPGHDL